MHTSDENRPPRAGKGAAGLQQIAMLSTGGTIASVPGNDGRAVAGALPGEELLAKTGLDGQLDVHVESVFQKPSNSIGASEWLSLATKCEELIRSGRFDGIVITHGTDTLEDTAFYLHSVVDTSRVPVVITGSQRVPHAMGSDAYANLRQAMELASCELARGLGVLVCFNQSVYSAGFARKVSSYQLHGFDAPGLGPVGMMDEGVFHLLQRPRMLPLLPLPRNLPRVDILSTYGGAEAAVAEAVLNSGPAAVVIDGLGRGQVPVAWAPAVLEALRQGRLIGVTTSTLHGPTHESYEYPGALHELVQAGAIAINHLSARKARIRLALSIAARGNQVSSVAADFDWLSTGV